MDLGCFSESFCKKWPDACIYIYIYIYTCCWTWPGCMPRMLGSVAETEHLGSQVNAMSDYWRMVGTFVGHGQYAWLCSRDRAS